MRSLLARKIAAQIDDRIPNQLTGPVIRNVAPAIDLMQLNAALRKEFIRGNDIRPHRVPPKSKHRRMLQQQQRIGDKVLLACRNNLLLDRKRLPVMYAAEMEEVDVHMRR